MRTSPRFVEEYKKRIRKLDGYRSAIIFPEQLLNINQKSIYRVVEESRSGSVSVTITTHGQYAPEFERRVLTSTQDIFDAEAHASEVIHVINKVFMGIMIFTSKADAVKYASKKLAASLDSVA